MTKAKPKPEEVVVTPVAVVEAAEMVKTTHEAAASVVSGTTTSATIIAAVVTVIVTAGTVATGYIQYLNNRLQAETKLAIETASSIAQESARDVKKSTGETVKQINNIKESTDETRAMGNHQTQILLELYAESAREVADYTKDPVKVSIAERAEKRLADHIEAQEQFNKSKKE